VHPDHEGADRLELPGRKLRLAATQLAFVLAGRGGQIDAEEPRGHARREEDHGEGAEQIGDRIGHADVRGQARDLLLLEGQRGDGLAGGADHRRLGGAAGQHPGRGALVEAEALGERQHREHHDHRGEQRQVRLLERRPTQAPHELRPDHVAERVDEQGEGQRLDLAGDRDAHLPDQDRHQQRRGHRTEHERADAKLAAQVAQGQGQGDRGQRGRREEGVQGLDHGVTASWWRARPPAGPGARSR
jgi:hypothetical protein